MNEANVIPSKHKQNKTLPTGLNKSTFLKSEIADIVQN